MVVDNRGQKTEVIKVYNQKECNDREWVLSKFRFETMEGEEDNWILTDIDDVLAGNPYFNS